MPNKLSELYSKAEDVKGKNLFVTLSLIFVGFLILGAVIGYIIPAKLKNDEASNPIPTNIAADNVTNGTNYQGKVVYVDPRFYPDDDVSFYLEDSLTGKKTILLHAKDEKLAVVEGLDVSVYGKVQKSKDGEENILLVDRIIVSNK